MLFYSDFYPERNTKPSVFDNKKDFTGIQYLYHICHKKNHECSAVVFSEENIYKSAVKKPQRLLPFMYCFFS